MFTEASKYLDSLFSAKTQGILQEGICVPLLHKLLVLSKPNPDDLNGLRYPRSWEWHTIDEEVEIKGSSSRFLIPIGHPANPINQ